MSIMFILSKKISAFSAWV